jgi:hypothetical protein
MTLEHCTVAGNSGGPGINSPGLLLTLKNSIVYGNGNGGDVQGNLSTLGANIVGSHSFGTLSGPQPLSTDPRLGPLADNGGPTRTMKPAGFPGAAVWFSSLPTDQRGQPRPAPTTNTAKIPILGAVETIPGPDLQVFRSLIYPAAAGETLYLSHVVPGLVNGNPFAALRLKNRGNQALSALAITIDGPDEAMFSMGPVPPAAIAPEAEFDFNVVFGPTSPGRKLAYLRIASNDPDQGTFSLLLTGIGDSTFLAAGTTGGTLTQPRNPTWNRPDGGNPPSELSAMATATPYGAVSCTVSDPGYYTFTSTTRNSPWKNTLFLYAGAFDASAPLLNVLTGSMAVDAFGLIGVSYALQPGIRYYAVTTGLANSDAGDYTLKITGPGEISGFAPPADILPKQSGIGVSAYPTFSWASRPGTTYEIFLGTAPGSMNSLGFHTSPFTLHPPLAHNTTYYWRLDSHRDGSVVSSGVLTFTTRASIEVTTVLDENDGNLGLGTGDSLREAIAAAATGAASAIAFAPALSGQTLRLAGTPLVVSTDLAIDGSPLPRVVRISGNHASRVFEIASGISVSMNALKITEGTTAPAEDGAGILNLGTLALKDTTLSGNSAHSGKGGGIQNAGILSLDSSTLSANDAMRGGGLNNEGAGASASLVNVTFSGNTASQGGGGIANASGAHLTLVHTTLSENFVDSGGGGGIELRDGTLTMENSIIAGNDARTGGRSIDRTGGTITIGGANLLGDNTSISTEFPSGLLVGTSSNGRDPLLSPLDFFGGRTQTRPPLAGSPALDAALLNGQSPSRDQRGRARPGGLAADLGAVESDLSANADLASLSISAGKPTPVFFRDLTSYSVAVAAAVSNTRVRVFTEDLQATVELRINLGAYAALVSGDASPSLLLHAGDNLIEVKVTAENGSDKTYSLTVRRGEPAATNTDLDALTISAGSLNPAFTPAVRAYSILVGNTTSSITITPSAVDPEAVLEVAGSFGAFRLVPSGTASSPLPLNVGSNPIEIRVTARDGVTRATHTLNVHREAPALSDANLSALVTSVGALHSAFRREEAFYHVKVAEAVASATVTATAAQPSATLTMRLNGGAPNSIHSGTASLPLPLRGGANLIEVTVTAADGITTRAYSLTIVQVINDLLWASKPGNNGSGNPSISADGRYVAFSSRSDTLVPEDTNNSEDVFVYDRISDAVERVSVNNAGVEGTYNGSGGKAHSRNPSISEDGRYVAFQSRADNLVPDDTNGQNDESRGEDIFVFDRTTRTIERVSVRDDGSQAQQPRAESPAISGNGRFVAFASGDNNLVTGFDPHSNVNLYLYDRTSRSLVGITVPFGDFRANRDSLNPSISRDGSLVAFEFAVDRSDFPQFQYRDIYVYLRNNQTLERITGDYEGLASDGNQSKAPSLSADGRYVAFQSNLDDIDFDDGNGRTDVFVYDRVTGVTERISQDGPGLVSEYGESVNPSLSGDGRSVAFESSLSGLMPSDTNDQADIFLRNLETDEITRLSVNAASEEGNSGSYSPSVSFDGRGVAFRSDASNLGDNGNQVSDVFIAVTEAPASSALARLASLDWNLDTQGTGFSPDRTSYTASVANDLSMAFLRPVPADPAATIAVRINSGAFSPVGPDTIASLPLGVGLNAIQVRVTAGDGATTTTYSIQVTRAASSNSKLAGLVLTGDPAATPGSPPPGLPLTPSFSPDVTAYQVGVPNESTSVTIVPGAAEPNASVTVNGSAVASGTATGAINLNPGQNPISIAVRAEDGVTTTAYVVTVVRALSSDARLLNLVPGSGGLLPAFDGLTEDYALEAPPDMATITLLPTAAQADATIEIYGEPVISGTSSHPINLSGGANTITVAVIAQDGATVKNYVVTVTRDTSGLSRDLIINGSFEQPVLNNVNVNNLGTIPTGWSQTGSGATWNLIRNDGTPYESGVDLPADGSQILDINGLFEIYQPFILPETSRVSFGASFANRESYGGSLSSSVGIYNATGSTLLSPLVAVDTSADPTPSVRWRSGASSVVLSAGEYQIRVAPNDFNNVDAVFARATISNLPSSNADLGSLVASVGTLTPVFDGGTSAYAVSVPNATGSMTVTPTAAQANATINVNGSTVTSGAASSAITLAVGSNPITIAVTAQDGSTVKTYVVTVTRATVPVEGTPGLNRLFYRARPGVTVAAFYPAPRGKGVFPPGAAPVGTAPTQSGTVAKFEAPAEVGEEYGQILHGYIVPSQTGDYTFYLCSDDQGELWLSTDESPVNSRLIAREPEYNPSRTWNSADRRPVANGRRVNVSASIRLEAGTYYYVEAVMKEGTGGDNLGVAWTLTGAAAPANGSEPILGVHLRTHFQGTPVIPNVAPRFTKGADPTASADSGAQSITGWATAISAGSAGEAMQTLAFLVTNNHPALFSAAPGITPTGTLNYTPSAGASGVAIITVQLQDDGGTANGGADTSAVQTFTITITATPPPTGRYSIGLNFGQSIAPEMLAATDIAGVEAVAQANWNNLSPESGVSTTAIRADANGSAQSTTVKVAWTSANLWSSTGRGEENNPFTGTDRKLLAGYLDTGSESITQVTISDIPATFTGQTYDVVVYCLAGVGGRGGGYRVTDAIDGSALTDWVRAQSPLNRPNYAEVATGGAVNTWGEGNYMVFRNLASSSIDVIGQTADGLGFGGNPRAPINAIQLVTSSCTGISIRHANGLITIQYTGRLESAAQAGGPYLPVLGASSPVTVIPDTAAKFYIAR